LTKLWVNLLSTGESVSAYGQIGRTSEFSIDGDVVTYAGGRQRGESVDGERSTYTFTLQDCTLAQRDRLRLWFGLPVIVRDHRGQAFYCTYFQINLNERTYELDLYEITITVQGVTVAQGV
jgi:hypothetical protein